MLPAIFTDHVRTVTVLTVLCSVLQHSLQLPRCSSTRQNDNTTNTTTPAGPETIWNKDQAKSDSFLI